MGGSGIVGNDDGIIVSRCEGGGVNDCEGWKKEGKGRERKRESIRIWRQLPSYLYLRSLSLRARALISSARATT